MPILEQRMLEWIGQHHGLLCEQEAESQTILILNVNSSCWEYSMLLVVLQAVGS